VCLWSSAGERIVSCSVPCVDFAQPSLPPSSPPPLPQALECVESALLGGFYFNHFRLAVNVIGGEARGTMNRAVAALQGTYERSVFPSLDKTRSVMGRRVDRRLSHLKGRIMSEIMDAQTRE
jgi:hypothetical protein